MDSIRVSIPRRHHEGFNEKAEESALNTAFKEIRELKEYQELPTQGKVEIEHDFYESSMAQTFRDKARRTLMKYTKKAG